MTSTTLQLPCGDLSARCLHETAAELTRSDTTSACDTATSLAVARRAAVPVISSGRNCGLHIAPRLR